MNAINTIYSTIGHLLGWSQVPCFCLQKHAARPSYHHGPYGPCHPPLSMDSNPIPNRFLVFSYLQDLICLTSGRQRELRHRQAEKLVIRSFRMFFVGCAQNLLSFLYDDGRPAKMNIRRRHQAQCTVVMLVVIPIEE